MQLLLPNWLKLDNCVIQGVVGQDQRLNWIRLANMQMRNLSLHLPSKNWVHAASKVVLMLKELKETEITTINKSAVLISHVDRVKGCAHNVTAIKCPQWSSGMMLVWITRGRGLTLH